MPADGPRRGTGNGSSRSGAAELHQLVTQLRAALIGLAERQLPDDPLPCFCVDDVHDPAHAACHVREVHDAWCEDARAALAASDNAVPRGLRAPQRRPLVVTLWRRQPESGGKRYPTRA